MQALDWLKNWLLTSLTSAAMMGAVVYLGRHWISQWLSRSIQFSFDQRLEVLKASHERELTLLRSALDTQQHLVSSAFLQAQSAVTERRLTAIQTLWDTMLQAYFEAPGIIAMTDILTTETYQMFFKHTKGSVPDFESAARAVLVSQRPLLQSAEKARLLSGDYLYALYKAYTAFIGSIIFKLVDDREKGRFQPWWEYDHILNLLNSVLTPQEFEEFSAMRIERYSWITRKLEFKFLQMASDIIDGKHAVTDALEQATKIIAAAKSPEVRQGSSV